MQPELSFSSPVSSRVARFFSVQHSKTGKNIPQNGHKIYQMTVKRPTGHKIDQNLPFQVPPKFTQIRVFCLKMCHLAILVSSLAGGSFKFGPFHASLSWQL
jgi:hypothetical protein